MVENCLTDGTKTFLHIILDWSDDDVWDYIHANNVNYCKLYDEGFKRLGCIMCPMRNKVGMLQDAEKWPKYYSAYLRAFEKTLQHRRATGKKEYHKTAEDMMRWWINRKPKGDPDQGVLFE